MDEVVATVRETTKEERAFLRKHKQVPGKYILIKKGEHDTYLTSFGFLINSANTRKEMVYWAERWVSKNGGSFERPPGWEKVVGAIK